jgi:hypothetical protein
MRKAEGVMAVLLENKATVARVHCPICTHTVEADVAPVERGWTRKMKVVQGQRCRRCSALLDAAYILEIPGGMN